jgi:hypothetical protein
MRTQLAIRLLACAAAAGAIAVPVSGCGGSKATLDPVAEAATVTSHLGGAHLSMKGEIGATGLASPITLEGHGFFNYKTQEGSLTLDISGLPASATQSLGSGSLRMEELFKSSVAYVGSPLFANKLPGGARWMKIDFGRFAQAIGLNLQQLASGQSNPAQLLQFLRATSGVSRSGGATVRGVPTTRYRATIDLAKAADVLPASNRDQARAALKKLIAQSGLSAIPVEVWVDAHKTVRRLTMDLSAAASGQRFTVHFEVELFDFGPTPPVTTPSESEVFDATKTALVGLGSSGG